MQKHFLYYVALIVIVGAFCLAACGSSGNATPISTPVDIDALSTAAVQTFIAGTVRFGLSSTIYDSRSNLSRKTRRSFPLHSAPGKHIPLWDHSTHQAILDELTRRGKDYRGRSNNQFTGLMHCGECGASMWMNYNGPRGPQRAIWRCSLRRSDHVSLPHVDALHQVGDALVHSLPTHAERLRTGQPADPTDQLTITLADLRRQRTRLEDAYLTGAFPLESYATRSATLESRIQETQNTLANQGAQIRRREAWVSQVTGLGSLADRLPAWLATDDPAHVNLLLHQLLDKIVVTRDGSVELHYKAPS